ncbi:homeobox protein NANOG [Mugil cephalus]|uniref:homeobox protein NANOG n=1 Tax=Mugil cephalus TaxID=48193 RepID=UPI001FB6A4A6|nr:homeobox protein NANOG [Mugil cephalus]
MADWKTQISYNYNPSYHAYAYCLVYQAGPEQNHENLTGWAETGIPDYNTGATQAYYAATTRTREESPPYSPEQHSVDGHCHYQGPGVVYLGDTQAGRLLLSGKAENEPRRAGSDSTSDSEPYTSPDSRSSGSSREGSLPQVDPATWVEKDEEASGGSPAAIEEVSSSLMEEPQTYPIIGSGVTNDPASLHVPLNTPKKLCTTAVNTPKGKVRTAFSESQMNALVHRFSVQRYLTPSEMKNLAELTGLTYKQVKTWFQNRRMKLRRHQKDVNWVSDRYSVNKDSPAHGAVYHNIASHVPHFQGEGRPQLRQPYSPHMMETAFKKTAPQNLSFYLAAMDSAAGSAGYPSWSSGSLQAGVSNRPQVTGWSVPPGVGHYEYVPMAFNAAGVATANAGLEAGYESKDGEPVDSQSSLNKVVLHNASQ